MAALKIDGKMTAVNTLMRNVVKQNEKRRRLLMSTTILSSYMEFQIPHRKVAIEEIQRTNALKRVSAYRIAQFSLCMIGRTNWEGRAAAHKTVKKIPRRPKEKRVTSAER